MSNRKSKTDYLKPRLTVNADSIGLSIMAKKIGFEEGMRRLERTGRSGLLVAAEICIESALKGGSIHHVSETLGRAQINLCKVIDLRTAPHLDVNDAKAMVHTAQMPIYASIAASNRLPRASVAERAYNSTVEVGGRLTDNFEELKSQPRNITMNRACSGIAGVLGELSVLELGQRYSLHGGLTEDWFPILAGYGKDHATKYGSLQSKSYDVDFMISNGDGEIESAYRAQVKCSPDAAAQKGRSYTDVALVVVSRDLRLPKEFRTPASVIPRECLVETSAILGAEVAEAKVALNARAELLLDILDRAA